MPKKPITIWRKWNKIPKGKRNSHVARALAKEAGMKSIAEVEIASLLSNRGLSAPYEPETWEYQYDVQHYTPDFKVGNIYIEVKGKATRETRKKLVAVKACNPDKKLVIVFLKGHANKITKGSKTSYIKWAEKNGFVSFDWDEKEELIKYIKDNM